MERKVLVPCSILDFLCTHPFNDGNGRISRFLTLLLLYHSGYTIRQYVNIEEAIADAKGSYYKALADADKLWYEEKNDPKPFIKYMLGVMFAYYKKSEVRAIIAEKSGGRSISYDIVKEFMLSKTGTFTKQEAMMACPSLGDSSVESALKKLAEDGTLTQLGTGRETHYVRSDAAI